MLFLRHNTIRNPCSLATILHSCQSELTKMLMESCYSLAVTSLSLWTEIHLRMSLNSLHNLRLCHVKNLHLPNCSSCIALCLLCTTESSAASDSSHKHVSLLPADPWTSVLPTHCSDYWPCTCTHISSFSRTEDVPSLPTQTPLILPFVFFKFSSPFKICPRWKPHLNVS